MWILLTVVRTLLTLRYTEVDLSRLLGGGVVIVVHLIIPKIHLHHCAKGQFLRASNKTSRFTIWNKDNMKDTIWRKISYNFVPKRNSKDLHSKSREAGRAMSWWWKNMIQNKRGIYNINSNINCWISGSVS